MSELPFGSIFSAAHASKWDALPEGGFLRATRSGFGLVDGPKRPPGLINVEDHSNDAGCDACNGTALSIREEEKTAAIVVAAHSIKSCEDMAAKTYTWITLWFLLTAPVIIWDAAYCFMRPRSMVGGDLHWIWEPYGLYQEVDYVYGVKALEENNGFTNAQSLLNVVETALNLTYVYLAYVSSWSGAPLVGFAAVIMTLSKTVLYWSQELYCGGCSVGHNNLGNLLLLWVLPNGLWLLFPGMIAWRLGGDILGSLSAPSQATRKIASGKTQ